MTKTYWFGRKKFGWGWFPITWQGWLSVVVLVLGAALGGLALGDDPSTGSVVAWIAAIVIATVALIGLSIAKGPRPRWQWNGPIVPKD